jgi:hypothetical protein
VAPPGVEAVLYDGFAGLPHFNPDDDPDGGPVHAPLADLRAQIAAADALLFCTCARISQDPPMSPAGAGAVARYVCVHPNTPRSEP